MSEIKKWEMFESEAVLFLEQALCKTGCVVCKCGGHNSRESDIQIFIGDGSSFFVETKMPKSQTSQFVLDVQDTGVFFSENNFSKKNWYSLRILKFLNNKFNDISEIRCSGPQVLEIPKKVSFGYIKRDFREKGIKFVVSKDLDNKFTVIPIERLDKFFDVKCILRRKKSGSRKLSEKYSEDFEKSVGSNLDVRILKEDNRHFVVSKEPISRGNCYINSMGYPNIRYFLSRKSENMYEVRILSNTNNINVIFSLDRKRNIDIEDFPVSRLIHNVRYKTWGSFTRLS